MKLRTRAFAVLGRVTWKVLAVFGSRYARQKLAGTSGPADRGGRSRRHAG